MKWQWLAILVVVMGVACLTCSPVEAWVTQARWKLGWLVGGAASAAADAALTTPGRWAGNWWAVLKPADPTARLVTSRLAAPQADYDVTPLSDTRELDGEIALAPPSSRYVFWQVKGKFWPVRWPAPELVTMTGQMVISEVKWQGDDQWIELYNHTSAPRQLQGLRLTAVNDAGSDLLFSRSFWVAPYSLVVIGRRTGTLTALARDPDWVEPRLGLTEQTTGISLLSVAGVVIDALPAGQWPAVPEGGLTSSLERRSLMSGETAWSNWSYCLPDNLLCRGVVGLTWKDTTPSAYGTPWLPPL